MRTVASVAAFVLALGAVQFRSGPATSAWRGGQNEEAADRGTIAVLRRDGLMVPFAAFQGTRWVAQWPNNPRGLELPVNLDSVPERWWGGGEAPAGWQAWPIGGTARPLKPVKPQIYPIHCAQSIGVRTDYVSEIVAPRVQVEPYPKDGIAATAGVRVEPVDTVSEGPDWSALAMTLLEEFNRAEDREASLISSAFPHPIARDKRRQTPVRIEALYRTALEDGTTVSYIEAARSYPPGPDDDECGLETLFTGWVTHEKGEKKPRVDLRARITYCDRVGATFMQPFGRIRVRDRMYWIAQVAGPESEWYVVAQIAPGRVRYVAEYFAGGRDSCR